MSLNTETTTTKVVTDASQSINELGRLEAVYAAMSRSIKDLTGRTKEDINVRKKIKAEQIELKKRIQDLRVEIGAEAMSYTQLQRAMKETRLEMGRMAPTMEGYEEKLQELVQREKDYKTAIEARKKAMSLPEPAPPEPEKKGWFATAKQAVSNRIGLGSMGGAALIGGIAGGVATMGIQLVEKFIDKAIEKVTEGLNRAAEKSAALSAMAAITGLDLKKDAADLKYYGDAAEYMGKKFNMSVPDVIGAMQKIGSIKPELLGAKEALAGLTEEAITLSRADGALSIEDAAVALVGSLNQFDKGADQSTRYMNVLAASAAAGSSEINQVAESFKVAGAVLSASNISFEQSNALVQVLAKRQILGSEAGTALRNVFSKLMVANKELNPSIVGVNTSLDNLAKLSPQKLIKMFGQENLVAAKTLIDLRGEVARLTKEMTGTTEATDQALKRMDNLKEDLEATGKSWDRLFDWSENQSSGFRSVVQSLKGVFDWVADIRKYWNLTWTDALGPIASVKKLFDASGKASDARKAAAQTEREKQARQEGDADYRKGTTEENLSKYEGKNLFEKERAYAKEYLAEARRTYGKLDKQIKYLESNRKAARAYDVPKMREQLARMAGKVVAGKNALADLDQTEAANKKMISDINRGAGENEDKAGKAAREKRKKHLAELAKLEIQNQNTIAENHLQAIENEEEREVQLRTLQYAKELQDAVNQEGDKTALFKSLEDRRNLDIDRIRKKYAEKRKEEELETAARLVDATRNLQLQEAENWVRSAEAKQNNQKEVFNARYNLSIVQEEQELARLKAQHDKEKEKYKENAVALSNLETAYQNQVTAIQKKGINDRQLFTDEDIRMRKQSALADKQRQLGNDVRQAELSGNPMAILNSRLAMLDLQMQAELDVTNQTEEQKNEIIRGYMLERDAMFRDFNKQLAVDILEVFNAGIQGIGRITSMQLQNEETQMNNTKARNDKRLDDQLKKGAITQEQYNIQKEKSDERYEKKQKELRRRKAEAEKKATLFEAAIQIPLAILKASPNPFAMVAAGIAGAAQLAVIAGTEIPAYAKGGPVGGKWNEGQIVRVGEKGPEWVAPNWQIMDPATGPTLEWLEERRASGTKGFAGSPPPGTTAPGGTDPLLLQAVAQITDVVSQLSGKLDNLHAKIYTDQFDDEFGARQSIMDDANVAV
ncbi:phage tail tape measure protein [Siphonobacter sp.]|uniref:phage tail tape measure protein n=1 Tax=Siphonobacter sp. TaxID=1869184 RepID=UPI003B3A980E